MKTGTLRRSADWAITAWHRLIASVGHVRITAPQGAYGSRQLRSTHNGPVVRVRRAFDNQEADVDGQGRICPTPLSATEWSQGPAFISVYYDQSGNGENIISEYAATQAEYHEP